jgi:hypothetical protein
MNISKKTVKGVLLYSLFYYILSIGAYHTTIYTMHKISMMQIDNLITIEPCIHHIESIVEGCKKTNIIKEQVLKNGFSEIAKNSSSMNKPFYLYFKSDHESDSQIILDFMIEHFKQYEEVTDEQILYKNDKISSMKEIKKAMSTAVNELWFMLYLLLNPLIPITIISIQYYFSHLVKKAYRYFSNKNQKVKEAYDTVASKNIKICMKLEDPDETILIIEKHRNS